MDAETEVLNLIAHCRAELRAMGKEDDDHTCLMYLALKLLDETRDGFHHNGQPHTTRP